MKQDFEKYKRTPSSTFLFDQFRSGRTKFKKGSRPQPQLLWSYSFPSNPIRGAESSPVFDYEGNLYFGCHDGCFYSLDQNGKLRWHFKTDSKIYSSPLFLENHIYVGGGDGFLYKFDTIGNLKGLINTASYQITKSRLKKTIDKILSLKTFDYSIKRSRSKIWASFNIDSKNNLYISSQHTGLLSINPKSFTVNWTIDLGRPRLYLSGVAINELDEIFVTGQRNHIFCLNSDGSIKWAHETVRGYDSWANPSIDYENETVYFPMTTQNQSKIYALDYNGNLLWETDIDGGVRGSITISYDDCVACCSMNGNVYFLSKTNGKIQQKKKVSDSQIWSTASVDTEENLFISSIDSETSGSITCLDKTGNVKWKYGDIGKAYSVPIIDSQNKIYVGSWRGDMNCFQS